MTTTYIHPGPERVCFDAPIGEMLGPLLDRYDRKRVLVVASRSVNRNTPIVDTVRQSLGQMVAAITDDVHEHAPVDDVLKIAALAREVNADALVSAGGGSVMDLCKMVQLCLTEDVTEPGQLADYASTVLDGEHIAARQRPSVIRQFSIPTTLSTAEVTPGTTPIDQKTRTKTLYIVRNGAPQALLYDPEAVRHTPLKLVNSTALRGLDHAINTACSVQADPLATYLAEKAIQLFVENLPAFEDSATARSACQRASFYTGLGQMSATHGFSHYMVHVLAPIADVAHSALSCVLMLAQARWFEGWADDRYGAILALIGRKDETFQEVILQLLERLDMPTSLSALGINDSHIDQAVPIGMKHPLVVNYNLRPINDESDLRSILDLVR